MSLRADFMAQKRLDEEEKEIKTTNQLKTENEEWKKANDCILTTLNVIAEGNKKLRQTLEEIKSLCYEQDLNEDFFACEILQKINECEV